MKRSILALFLFNITLLRSMDETGPLLSADFQRKAFNIFVTISPNDQKIPLNELDQKKATTASLMVSYNRHVCPENLENAEKIKDKLPKVYAVFQADALLEKYRNDSQAVAKVAEKNDHEEVQRILDARKLIESYLK